MTDFKLSKKALPDTVMSGGRAFQINSDFRTMLKIFRMLSDPDVIEGHKTTLLCKWFFVDDVPDDWPELFGDFARCGDAPSQGGNADFDYDFDAPEIYSSFMQLYGIDLFNANLHWWKFRALLSGCFSCKCALAEKIRIRNLDVSKCDDKAAATRAKQSVQIPLVVGEDEQLRNQLIAERLMRGEPISDLL